MFETLKENCKCCCCEGSLSESEYVNLVETKKLAAWAYPQIGNVLTGEEALAPAAAAATWQFTALGIAVAVLCDGCIEAGRQPLLAIEFQGREITYHDLDDLADIGEVI